MMRKSEAKLSQFAGVVILILFFVFSMLYLMFFQSVDDIMRATLSVNSKIIALRCDGILNAYLSAEYHKSTNTYLFSLDCSGLGRDFLPLNETHCIDRYDREDIRKGVYDENKVNAYIIGSWYRTPQLILTPLCEEVSREIYVLLIRPFHVEDFEDGGDTEPGLIMVDVEEYDEKMSVEGGGELIILSVEGNDVFIKPSSYNVQYRNSSGTFELANTYSIIGLDIIHKTDEERLTCSITFSPSLESLVESKLEPTEETLWSYGILPSRIREQLEREGFIVRERPLQLCSETYAGECGDVGIRLPKDDYYHYTEKIEKLNERLQKVQGMTAQGGIFSGAFFVPQLGPGSEYCETPVFSVVQVGNVIRKGILDAKAYIAWG